MIIRRRLPLSLAQQCQLQRLSGILLLMAAVAFLGAAILMDSGRWFTYVPAALLLLAGLLRLAPSNDKE